MGAITGQRGWERAQKSAEVGHVAPALGADASPERALVPVVDVRQLGCVGRDWKAVDAGQIEQAGGDEADSFEVSAYEEARHLNFHGTCAHGYSTRARSAVFGAALQKGECVETECAAPWAVGAERMFRRRA